MKYRVISGDFSATIDTNTPRQAAEEAFGLWKLKVNKPTLAKITMVVKPDNNEFYLSTSSLLEAI
jgi:hypothetical protein